MGSAAGVYVIVYLQKKKKKGWRKVSATAYHDGNIAQHKPNYFSHANTTSLV